MKQNLLYIVTKLELGGAQKHVLDLIRQADRSRFSLFLLSARDGLLWEEARSIPGVRMLGSRFMERRINPVKDVLAFLETILLIRRYRIDVVHTHSSKAGILGRWAARVAGVKIIIHTVHGWSFHEHQPFLLRAIFRRLERSAAVITDKIIVVSSWDKQKGLRCGVGSPDQYVLIPYGIETEIFHEREKDASLRRELGLRDDDLVVGNISCLKKQKKPQDFIKLAYLAKVSAPGVKFLLVGDGELKKEVSALRKGLGLERDVYLLGWRRDIPRFLRAIDVFVLTSLWEGLPISVLEAMAASKPVLVTDTEGVRDVVREGETGFLVAPGDVEGMKEKLVALLRDRLRREQVGRCARQALGDRFHLKTMMNDTGSVYAGLLEEKGLVHAG